MRKLGPRFDEQSKHLDRFGPLLVLTVLTVTGMSLIDLGDSNDRVWPSIASTTLSVVIGLTLLLAFRASGVARPWQRVADASILLAAVISVVLLVVDLTTTVDLTAFESDRPSPIWVAIAILTPVAVIRRLIRHRRVTVETMFGAVAAYLLIAVAFAYAFLYVEASRAAPFFAGSGDEPSTSFMYFSLASITTVGYGDLAPVSAFGRLLATSEAVIGQVYLVTFVAMFVGLFIQQRDGGGR